MRDDRHFDEHRAARLLAAALAGLEHASVVAARGVVLLGAEGGVEYATESARRLLAAFFPGAPPPLPPEVAWWLDRSARPLVARCGRGRLRIHRSGDALLLEEGPQTELTPREHEVLSLVARGQTNAQVAQALWVSPGTVRKHLEHAFAKLGVSTRTAAAARLLAREADQPEPAAQAS